MVKDFLTGAETLPPSPPLFHLLSLAPQGLYIWLIKQLPSYFIFFLKKLELSKENFFTFFF